MWMLKGDELRGLVWRGMGGVMCLFELGLDELVLKDLGRLGRVPSFETTCR